MTLIGGWAPYFILERYGRKSYEHDHIGSIDIDLALNSQIVSEKEYANIEQLIKKLGYTNMIDSNNKPVPFIFLKTFTISNIDYTIEVDFVGSYYSNKGHRHQRVSGLLARKCHGVDIVFDNFFKEQIKGQFPEGGKTEQEIKIANIVILSVSKTKNSKLIVYYPKIFVFVLVPMILASIQKKEKRGFIVFFYCSPSRNISRCSIGNRFG